MSTQPTTEAVSIHQNYNVADLPAWPAKSAMAFIDELFAFMQTAGSTRYDDQVTQLEHSLQTAHLADRAFASDQAIAAALLHDIGHLLQEEHDAQSGFLHTDLEHEQVGAKWLLQMFPTGVVNPIRDHVRAKRYLCSNDEKYWTSLSESSRRSFELQGGAMSVEALEQFEKLPHFTDAIALRRRDDGGKVKGRNVPGLEHYRALLASLIKC